MEPSDKDEDEKREKEPEEEPFVSTGRTIDAEGNLQSPAGAPAPHRSSVLRSQPEGREFELEHRGEAEALELEARAPRPQTDYAPLPPAPQGSTPTHGPSAWPLLLFLLLAGAGAWYYFYGQHLKGPPPRIPIAVTITITSQPNGAAVTVEGHLVGVTPWAVDNTWAPGPVKVGVTMPGYRPWSGTFAGGVPARLEARLQPR